MEKRYKVVSHDGNAYVIFEYRGPTPIFAHRGFLHGNVFKLYPLYSMCRGEHRTKTTIAIGEVVNA